VARGARQRRHEPGSLCGPSKSCNQIAAVSRIASNVRQVPLFFSTPGFCTQSRFLRVISDAILLQRTHWTPARRLTLRLSL